jgi:Tfp pilus assembly protein PilN
MKIRLNVATRPLESHRRFVAGAALAGFVGIAALLLLASTVVSTWRKNRGQRAQIAGYEARLSQLEVEQGRLAAYFGSPKTKTVMDRAEFLNSLIDQRTFPWTTIFTDLEKTLPAGVRVISIAPKMEHGQVDVTLVIGAEGNKNEIAFLQALQSSAAFSHVQVSSEKQAVNQPGSTDQVDVELQAVYSGAEADPK